MEIVQRMIKAGITPKKADDIYCSYMRNGKKTELENLVCTFERYYELTGKPVEVR